MIRPGELSTPEDGLTIEQRFSREVLWQRLLTTMARQPGPWRLVSPDPDPLAILRGVEEAGP